MLVDYLPLAQLWPSGLARTSEGQRRYGTFKVIFGAALTGLQKEIGLWGASNFVLGSNLQIGRAGVPIFVNRTVNDPGAAVPLMHGEQPVTFCADQFRSVEANLRALSLTMKSMRAIKRYGCDQVFEQMMTGLLALPAPGRSAAGRCIDGQGCPVAAAQHRLVPRGLGGGHPRRDLGRVMRPAPPTPRTKTTDVVLIGLLVLMVVAGAAEVGSSDAQRIVAACHEQEMADDRP